MKLLADIGNRIGIRLELLVWSVGLSMIIFGVIFDDRRMMMGEFVTPRIVLDWVLGDEERTAAWEEDSRARP